MHNDRKEKEGGTCAADVERESRHLATTVFRTRDMKSISVIVLNFNGCDLLRESLPPLERALANMDRSVEVIVADNGSHDGSVEYVQRAFPSFRVLQFGHNYGFGEGNNRAAREAKGDILIFLNNDMIVREDFLDPLVQPFEDRSAVFAVTSQVWFQDEAKPRVETGKTAAFWDRGTVRFVHQPVSAIDEEREYVPVFWAGGGSSAIDREKFLALGGFRALYTPAYVEDADLSYRAWVRGWEIFLSTGSRVIHKHRSTSGKVFEPDALEALICRNQLLFIWANVRDWNLLLPHMARALVQVLRSVSQPQARKELRALLDALPFWFAARRELRRDGVERTIGDRHLLVEGRWREKVFHRKGRLSILFVCPYMPGVGVHAGAGRMFHLIKGVAEHHDVTLLSFVENETDLGRAEHMRTICRSVRTVHRGGHHDEPDWFHIKPRRRLGEFANPEMKRLLQEEAASGRYDIIQYEYIEMGYLEKLVRHWGIPSILTHHEVQHRALLQELQRKELSFVERLERRVQWMKMLNFELSLANRFNTVITMTEQDKMSLMQYDPSLPIVVNETGVDVPYFSNGPRTAEEERSIVFLGYYRHKPNEDAVEYFVDEIFPHILRQYPDTVFYAVGAEPTEKVERLHDGKRVIVTGRLEDTRPSLARGSVFVVPVRLGAGIRGKILEAWSLRRAVVSTPLGCSGLAAQDGENLLVAGDPASFARAVIRLFEDQPLRQRLGERGFETARTLYDWPLQIGKHLSIYDHILHRDGV